MKIRKFNESNNTEEYYVMMIINNSSEIIESGIFETENDMECWLLNIVNKEILKGKFYSDEDEEELEQDTVLHKGDSGYVYIDFVEAVNWYQDVYDCSVTYDKMNLHKNCKLLYGVDKIIDMKKYNL
jgi:hypothetical protein